MCLIFTLFILTNCNTNCSRTAKYWKNMALKKKKFQSYSFGDQQLTEPLLHRHIHSLIYFNNTFNYGNGLSHRVDHQRLNPTIYEFMISQQTISQQCVLCWAKRALFVYPAMFPHLPEHLASRYVIFLCMCYHGT